MSQPARDSGSTPSVQEAPGYTSSGLNQFAMPLDWQDSGIRVRADTSGLLKFSIVTAIPRQSPMPTFWQHSLKAQRHTNWEHIVLEYGGTSSKAMWHAGHCPDQVLKPVEPLYSRTEALNKGLALASGDIIAFLPLNSVYKHEDVFLRVAERMQDPEVDLVYGNLECVSSGGARRMIKAGAPGICGKEMLRTGLLPHEECVFIRRDWWQFFGGFETTYQHCAGVARLLDLLTQPGLEVDYMDEVLVQSARRSEAGSSSLSRLLEEVNAFSRRNLLGVYLTYRSWRQRTVCE